MGIVYSFFDHLDQIREFVFQKQIDRRKQLWRRKFEYLYGEVDSRILVAIEDAGFITKHKDRRSDLHDWSMDRLARGLQFFFKKEARIGEQVIYVHFARYPFIEFQIMFWHEVTPKFYRSACLAQRNNEVYGHWGKPRRIPLRYWDDDQSSQIVDRVYAILPQVFRFLDREEIGPNIGNGSD